MARRRLDLKGDRHRHLVVGTAAAGRRERREEDRGGRRRDLRGRPSGGKVVRECEGNWCEFTLRRSSPCGRKGLVWWSDISWGCSAADLFQRRG
jgi:hypothetical protein